MVSYQLADDFLLGQFLAIRQCKIDQAFQGLIVQPCQRYSNADGARLRLKPWAASATLWEGLITVDCHALHLNTITRKPVNSRRGRWYSVVIYIRYTAGCVMDKSTETTDASVTPEDRALIRKCLDAYISTTRGDPRPVLAEVLSTRMEAMRFVEKDKWANMVNNIARFINASCMHPTYRKHQSDVCASCHQALDEGDMTSLDHEALTMLSEALELHYRIHLLQYGIVTEVQRYGSFSSASKDEVWDAVSSWNSGGPGIRNTAPSSQRAAKLQDRIKGLIKILRNEAGVATLGF